MQKEDNRNFILALALSFIVIVAWQFFYAGPQTNKQREAQQTREQQSGAPTATSPQPGAPVAPGAPAPAPAAPQVETREQALAQSPRVVIDTPSIAGSIALIGGRIDDVSLKRYRETVNPSSPIIKFMSPSGSPHPLYAEFGWAATPGGPTNLPNATTLWTADSNRLTPEKPLTLTFDSGQGLLFKRVISVDANAMFTVTDSVENKGTAPVSLANYALISRHGAQQVAGYYILHEGPVGVIGEQGLQEISYAQLEKDKIKQFNKGAVGGFLGFTDKYWAAALIPDQKVPYDARVSFDPAGALKRYQTDILTPVQTIEPGKTVESMTRLFSGAKEVAAVDGYEKSLGIKSFDLLIDWGWFYFITKPLFGVIHWFYQLTGNFGVAILIVTVLVKILFF
ncbi:MAG: membrane protein insertase YidC, partial [Beijerinckiaceae bacterium]